MHYIWINIVSNESCFALGILLNALKVLHCQGIQNIIYRDCRIALESDVIFSFSLIYRTFGRK